MGEKKFHIYNHMHGINDPLCYFESEDQEWGAVLEFDTKESAESFIQSAINSGDRSAEFFKEAFIIETTEICEGGFINATNLYIGIDGKLYELGDTRGLE